MTTITEVMKVALTLIISTEWCRKGIAGMQIFHRSNIKLTLKVRKLRKMKISTMISSFGKENNQ